MSFAGQRDDGFYADIQAVFDLLKIRTPGKDSQGGFNSLDGAGDPNGRDRRRSAGRRRLCHDEPPPLHVLADGVKKTVPFGEWVQVGRQGNPLFNEALVALEDKDLYSRTQPTSDKAFFRSMPRSPSSRRSSTSSSPNRTFRASRPTAPTSRGSYSRSDQGRSVDGPGAGSLAAAPVIRPTPMIRTSRASASSAATRSSA